MLPVTAIKRHIMSQPCRIRTSLHTDPPVHPHFHDPLQHPFLMVQRLADGPGRRRLAAQLLNERLLGLRRGGVVVLDHLAQGFRRRLPPLA